ncbi:MAG: ABC transporter ATP-binding protein, partial [Methanobacterium sp.]
MNSEKFFHGSLWKYIKDLKNFNSKNITIALALMIFTSLTEGISLLLLVPLLQLVGLNVQQGSLEQIAVYLASLFNYFGITLTLANVLLIYVVIISLNAFITKLTTTETAKIEFEFAAHLRKRLFKKITGSNWIFFTRNRSSDFAHALTYEIERISVGTGQFLVLLSSLFILAVYLIFALKISGLITGLVFLVGIILLLLLRRKAHEASKSGDKLTESTKDMYSSAIQHLDGMKTVKSFNMEEKNVEEFSRVADEVSISYLQAIGNYADVRLLFDIGSVIILSIIVYFLITVINISTAELLILLFLFVRMIPRFSTIQNSYQYFINMLPAFGSVKSLEKECKNATEDQEHIENVNFNKKIEFKDVTFQYIKESGSFGIRKLNLEIKAGKTTAIAGLSGAGKSTVADLVMELINPDEGQILIDGNLLNSENVSSWRSQIGYVDQDTFLFNDTVRNNLLFADMQADENDMWNALKSASADEFIQKLPDGLDTLIGDRGVILSGGERQRVALARALLRSPSLLILDEATSNLDSVNEQKIMEAIENLHGNLSILIIAHRLSTIKNA